MEIKNLNEVCIINMGQSPDSSSYNDKKEGLAFYQGNADFGEIHPTTRVWCNNPIKIAEKDDILISVRAPIGSMNIANEKCCIGRGLASIKPIDKNECNQNYLYYFLESKVPYMQSKGTGSTFKAINKGILTSLQIKLPNIREQEKISSIISKIKAQIHNKKLQIRKYDELVKSQFIEMFGNVFTQKAVHTLGDYISDKTDKVKKDYLHENIKYVDISSIDNTQNEITSYTTYKTQDRPSRAQQIVEDGDIVISTVRPNLNNVAMIKDDFENIVASTGFCVLKKNMQVNEYFIFTLVKDSRFADYLSKLTTGASYPAVSNKSVLNFKIDMPPIELQNKFAEIVKHIDKLKFTLKEEIKKLQECYNSLMKEYFE